MGTPYIRLKVSGESIYCTCTENVIGGVNTPSHSRRVVHELWTGAIQKSGYEFKTGHRIGVKEL